MQPAVSTGGGGRDGIFSGGFGFGRGRTKGTAGSADLAIHVKAGAEDGQVSDAPGDFGLQCRPADATLPKTRWLIQMTSLHDNGTRIAIGRLTLLFCIFFLIASGLGYPVLNRFDPRQTPGLSDVRTYAALVTGGPSLAGEDMQYRRFRVLVPWIAKPFYALARGRVASWDPVMFGLLVADSLLVAGTAVFIVIMGSRSTNLRTSSGVLT